MRASLNQVAVLFATLVLGAGAASAATDLRVRIIDAGRYVKGAAQTPDGVLWLATKKGLLRYDGVSITPSTLEGQPAGAIAALVTDGRGELWLAAQGSLFRLERGRLHPHAQHLATGTVLALLRDGRGHVWAFGDDAACRTSAQHPPICFRAGHELPAGALKSWWNAADGAIWIETDRGWWYHDAGSDRFVLGSAETGWGERAQVILRFSLGAARSALAERSPHLDVLTSNRVVTSFRDSRQTLWLASSYGLFRVQGTTMTLLTSADGLPVDHITSFAEDAEGGVWATTHGGRLIHLAPPSVTALDARSGLAPGTMYAVAEASDGTIYTTSNQGLSRIAASGVRQVNAAELEKHSLRGLLMTREDVLWITTLSGLLFRQDGERFEAHPLPEIQRPWRISAMNEDAAGVVWLGSADGHLLRGGSNGFMHVRTAICSRRTSSSARAPCAEAANAFATRSAGGLWMGTFGDGLWTIDSEGKVSRHPGPSGKDDAAINALVEDAAGALWLATSRGLVYERAGRQVRLTQTDGLPDDAVEGLAFDRAGHLWLATLAGVARLDRGELEARIENGQAPLHVRVFDSRDGLPSDELMSRADAIVLLARDGRLWFVTTAGLGIVSPASMVARRPPATVIIDAVATETKRFDYPNVPAEVTVPPGRADLMVQYTAPTFLHAHRISYSTFLEGFDERWSAGAPRRTVQYTNLPPGRYTLHVAAYHDDAPHQRSFRQLRVEIQPRFHQTPYFVLLLAAAALSAAAALLLVRSARARARLAAILDERARIARDLHDSLAQVFSALALQLETHFKGAAPDDPTARRLAHLQRTIDHGRRVARTAIWNVRAANDTPEALETSLQELATLYEGAQIAVTLSGTPYLLPLRVQNEVLQIAQQAVSNAVEHGKAEHIGIELSYEPKTFGLWVRDDGVGFSGPANEIAAPGHYGLKGMEERAQRAGGSLLVESSPGVGTEVGFVIQNPRGAT